MSRAALRSWIFGLCFVCAPPMASISVSSTALASDGCATVLETSGVELVSCPIGRDRSALVLTVPRDSNELPLHIEAVTQSTGGEVAIQSFRLTSGGAVSAQDQARLREVIEQQNVEQMNVSEQKFLSLVVDLIRPGELIADPAERNPALLHPQSPAAIDGSQSSYLGSYTMICSSIGKTRLSTYAVGGQNYAEAAVIGTVAQDCLGRCGPGCEDSIPLHPNKHQYTQECLNHDMCIGSGAGIRACSDEFWAAAPGYLNAPDCY